MGSPELDTLARTQVVEPGVAPAAVLAAGCRGALGWRFSAGAAGTRSSTLPTPIDPSTPFDLASVTKPFVACAAARLVRAGAVGWDTPLGQLVPEVAACRASGASLELLLSHRAGLAAHGCLYRPLLDGRPLDGTAALRQAADALRPDCEDPRPPEGFAPVYSDLGYLLLGEALARAAGIPLADLVEREVSGPLGLAAAAAAIWRARDPRFLDRVAPTEVMSVRGGEIVGIVHDENAWALSGAALSGHAGLFGTAVSVAHFGAAVLDALAGLRPDWLHASEASLLVRPRAGGTLRAGFDGRANEGSSAGQRFGPNAFGHLGFTGTSLWCDPDADVVAVILTNRVSPSRDNVGIRQARPALNDALFQAALALGGQR